jgi:hypothetical protein
MRRLDDGNPPVRCLLCGRVRNDGWQETGTDANHSPRCIISRCCHKCGLDAAPLNHPPPPSLVSGCWSRRAPLPGSGSTSPARLPAATSSGGCNSAATAAPWHRVVDIGGNALGSQPVLVVSSDGWWSDTSNTHRAALEPSARRIYLSSPEVEHCSTLALATLDWPSGISPLISLLWGVVPAPRMDILPPSHSFEPYFRSTCSSATATCAKIGHRKMLASPSQGSLQK